MLWDMDGFVGANLTVFRSHLLLTPHAARSVMVDLAAGRREEKTKKVRGSSSKQLNREGDIGGFDSNGRSSVRCRSL